ncbi:Type III secretion bridge between inner and outermembrane lipoprotein (YscJ,HrcJ,EscJ, PscJ) [Candidatus Rhodobacter oscarellae]|uniref:Lipoprotein n=1 Tax=Candidatus Rhodobacter oscarellae TaxID=1675527 RepID=A0A0J9E3G9_9RHOB|nr:type III secretion inner membrane ring lipoprotein SctJ [Candidatus Rhodobacter lobularis]KMW56369.1 Type III secretion bridge between inner and outermembrane lipoprotein (YscJ,HrcJ,EscJ, PscJ) [Candidatus Rhodobacter lobularis]
MISAFRSFFSMRLIAVLCAALALAGCKTSLYSGLAENEANVIVALLSENGISASKELDSRSGEATILVEEADFSRAVSLLELHGLPQRDYATMEKIFSGGGLVASPIEENARLNYAITQELSRTIAELDGILSARVHIVLPNEESKGSLRNTPQNKVRTSASVVIRRRENLDLEDLLPRLKHMVSNSVEGLEYGDVAVVDFPVPDTAMETRPMRAALPSNSTAGDLTTLAMGAGIGTLFTTLVLLALWQFKLLRFGFAQPHDAAPSDDIYASEMPTKSPPDRKLVRLEDMAK